MRCPESKRRFSSAVPAFSLLELLVVIGIIALLISISVPAYNRVSRIGKRTKCAANLKSLGNAIQSFMTDNESMLPDALGRPSDQAGGDAGGARGPSPAPIYLLLSKELKSRSLTPGELESIGRQSGWPGEKYPAQEVFRCPADRIREPDEREKGAFESYFDREGTSYEWNDALSGRRLNSQLLTQMGSSLASTPLLWDFEAFHPGRNRLYADLRVDATER